MTRPTIDWQPTIFSRKSGERLAAVGEDVFPTWVFDTAVNVNLRAEPYQREQFVEFELRLRRAGSDAITTCARA